jgi:putative salt-induced outer membrane protein YdiY
MNIFKMLFLYLIFGTNIFAQDCVGDIEAWHSNFATIEARDEIIQNFNMGFSNTTGNTKHLDVNAKYDFTVSTLSYNGQLLKIIFDTSLFFTQTDSEKSNEEYLLNLGLEQELDKEWLTYFALNWLRNPEFKNYDHKTSIGTGMGKNLFFNDSQSITLKLGTAYTREDYANKQPSEGLTSLNEYLEYKNQLNKISKLYLKTGALQHFKNFHNDYEILAILGVNFNVGEKIHLTLEQEIAYDNLPPIGFKKTDTKSIVRLGYKF